MPETPRILPLYHVSDPTMLERLAAIQNLFAEDLADFTGFDPDFNAAFRVAWTADREAAEALPTDESIQDESAMLTEAVEAAMAEGRDKWVQIKYFIEKAFPGSPASLNAFGADDYAAASVVQRDFIGFLENLHAKAEKYSEKLIAAKYTQPQINEIETLRDTLFNANRAQEDFKKDRLKATEERRIAMNKVYTTLLQVNKAAQIIYINSAAKRAQYVFDPNGAGGSEAAQYTGSLGPNEVKAIATVPYHAAQMIKLENTGGTVLRFRLNVAAETDGPAHNVLAGETSELSMAALNPEPATFLRVENTAATPGAYIVTVG